MTQPVSFFDYDKRRFLQVFCFLLLCLFGLGSPSIRQGWLKTYRTLSTPARSILFAIAMLGGGSVLTAEMPWYAGVDLSLTLLLFGLTLTIAALYRLAPNTATFLAIICPAISAVFYLIYYGSEFVINAHENDPLVHEVLGNMGHIRFFSQWQSWTLPVIALPMVFSNHALTRRLCFMIAASWWALAFMSGTRGTAVGLAAGMIAAFFLFPVSGRPWLRLQCPVIAGGLGLYLIASLIPAFLDPNISGLSRLLLTNPNLRIELWQSALQMATSSPWLGVGPMHYAYGATTLAAHPHNIVMQLLAEWGLPVTVLVMMLSFYAIFHWLRLDGNLQNNPDQTLSTSNLIYAGITASLITAGVHALFSGIFIMPVSQVSGMIIIGYAIGYYQAQKKRGTIYKRDTRRIHTLLFPLLFVGSSIMITAETVRYIRERSQQNYIPYGIRHNIIYPRFWGSGYFIESDKKLDQQSTKTRHSAS